MAGTSPGSRARSTDDRAIPNLEVPGLQITGEIGSGIRGTVYSATDGRRSLALKILRRGIHVDSDTLQRFTKSSSRRIRHPNLSAIELVGKLPDGSLYYASPLLRGDPLDRLLHEPADGSGRRPSLSVFALDAEGCRHPHIATRGTEIFVEAIEGLALAHQQGIVHRRLSPRNLHLTPAGRLIVTDFGGEPSTEAGDDLVYRAPEQLDPYPENVGAQADVYSLGTILYEALTRRLPFEARSPRELKAQIQEGSFPSPDTHAPELPASLAACIVKAMSANPADRYADAAAFASDLRAFLRGEQPLAARESAPANARTARFDGHLWARVGAAALILCAFVAWRWPRNGGPPVVSIPEVATSGTVLSLNPGAAREAPGEPARATATSLPLAHDALAPSSPDSSAARVPVPRTSLADDPIARDLAQSNSFAKAAALTRLRLEIGANVRPRSDALLAAWCLHDEDVKLRRLAIETIGLCREADPILRLLNLGDDLPLVSLEAVELFALQDALARIEDDAAVRMLCAWDLDTCETVDSAPAPASLRLPPNIRLAISEETPRELTSRWVKAMAELDPDALLAAAPRLADREALVGGLIWSLQQIDSPGARNALVRIAREHGYSGGKAALKSLAALGAHRELLDLARSDLPTQLRAHALKLLGEGFGDLYTRELSEISVTSPEAELRKIAFASLASSNDARAAEALPAAIQDPELREAALRWAARLPVEPSPTVFLELLSGSDFEARMLAVERIADATSVDFVEPLVTRLLDPRRFTREAALEAIFSRGELIRIPETMSRLFRRADWSLGSSTDDPIEQARSALEEIGAALLHLKAALGRVTAETLPGKLLSQLSQLLLRGSQTE